MPEVSPLLNRELRNVVLVRLGRRRTSFVFCLFSGLPGCCRSLRMLMGCFPDVSFGGFRSDRSGETRGSSADLTTFPPLIGLSTRSAGIFGLFLLDVAT